MQCCVLLQTMAQTVEDHNIEMYVAFLFLLSCILLTLLLILLVCLSHICLVQPNITYWLYAIQHNSVLVPSQDKLGWLWQEGHLA